VFDARSQRFFAVNPGDNSISMMALDAGGRLTVLSTVPSGGMRPVSITVSGDAVYVANQGAIAATPVNANISGFKITGNTLTAIAGSTRPMSATTDVRPTNITFSPDGKFVVVAERLANKLSTFALDANGAAQAGMFQSSAGMQPFAFDWSPEGFLVVAEVGNGTATGSSASSYSISATGTLTPITSALPTQQGAACWIAMAAATVLYVLNQGGNLNQQLPQTTAKLEALRAKAVQTTAATKQLGTSIPLPSFEKFAAVATGAAVATAALMNHAVALEKEMRAMGIDTGKAAASLGGYEQATNRLSAALQQLELTAATAMSGDLGRFVDMMTGAVLLTERSEARMQAAQESPRDAESHEPQRAVAEDCMQVDQLRLAREPGTGHAGDQHHVNHAHGKVPHTPARHRLRRIQIDRHSFHPIASGDPRLFHGSIRNFVTGHL
jgi:hypothetical protein